LVEGARKNRRGRDFEAFCLCEDLEVPLIVYRSPDDDKGTHLKGRLEDYYREEFIDLRGVVIKDVRIDRCRPIFRYWGLQFTLQYDDGFLAIDDIKNAMKYAAIGDFRPRFGRFRVEVFKELKQAA
jgi:hypothetical protein